jgi:hypothetical protein
MGVETASVCCSRSYGFPRADFHYSLPMRSGLRRPPAVFYSLVKVLQPVPFNRRHDVREDIGCLGDCQEKYLLKLAIRQGHQRRGILLSAASYPPETEILLPPPFQCLNKANERKTTTQYGNYCKSY